MEKYLDVGCLSNDGYAQHLGTTLYSLLENCSVPKRVRISILDLNISNSNKENLNKLIKKFGAKIKYLKPKDNLFKKINFSKRFGKETYYRFSMIESIKTDKLLSIDSDMIIKSDVVGLFKLKFKENVIFAVRDLDLPAYNRKRLGLALNTPYFNSGFLLIDKKKWKRNKITEKALSWIRENSEISEFADQDGLNMALFGKWCELDQSWNVLTKLFYYKYIPFVRRDIWLNQYMRKKIENPKVIHYTGFLKPWFFFDPVPFKREYLKYLDKTPWNDYKFPDLKFSAVLSRIVKMVSFGYNKFIKNR